MAAITAAAVNELRQATGCGLMDCKKALVENEELESCREVMHITLRMGVSITV